MKRFLNIFVVLLPLFLCSCNDDSNQKPQSVTEISNSEIYFFYQNSCPHCHHAADYIKQKYPHLKINALDVANKDNLNLFLKCVYKFKLDKSKLGTPLFCMGNHYIMGWSDTDAKKFDSYVQHFK